MAEGSVDAGIEKIAGGMLAFEAGGDNRNYYLFSYVAISMYLEAHRVADGIALTCAFANGPRWRAALRSRPLSAQGRVPPYDMPAGERSRAVFREAISIARHRRAKSFELRATISLARLLATQGREKEAHRMLAGIYSWFTEGFDTADLRDAKALLDELGP